MAEAMPKATSTDTDHNPERTSLPKRRPPKLKRNVAPNTGPSEEGHELNNGPNYGQSSGDNDRNMTRTGTESAPEAEYSDPEVQADETDIQGDQGRAEQGQTAVIDRPKTTPVGNWQRRERGRRGNQQLVPVGDIGDVGKTVNGAVSSVQDVGSKAINTAGNTVGKTLGSAVGASQNEEKGKDEQLRLRLDLNLDIEVQLKAKIHGDLTLQLL
ncbi:hypothetical protein BDV59DRAFT_205254 [Aspergillus ambiguus]|uniref:uncharacterized protein n=1 Tax=Aspergillus ambiguus TaxID=176160 RepID=UPI003CCCCB95